MLNMISWLTWPQSVIDLRSVHEVLIWVLFIICRYFDVDIEMFTHASAVHFELNWVELSQLQLYHAKNIFHSPSALKVLRITTSHRMSAALSGACNIHIFSQAEIKEINFATKFSISYFLFNVLLVSEGIVWSIDLCQVTMINANSI